MFKVSTLILLVPLCAALGQYARADDLPISGDQGTSQYAIDMKSSYGVDLKFEYYSQNLKTISDTLRQFLVADMTEVLKYLNKQIDNMIDKPPSFFEMGKKIISISNYLRILGKAQSERRKPYNIDEKVRKAINKDMSGLFTGLMAKAKKAEKSLKGTKKDPKQLKEDVRIFINSLLEGFQSSPVASYVNWSTGTMNGETFEERAGELMGRLRYNGLAGLLSTVQVLISVVLTFTS